VTEVQGVLLSLLSTKRLQDKDLLFNLSEDSLNSLKHYSKIYRLGPHLGYMLKTCHSDLVVPQGLREFIHTQAQSTAIRSLIAQRSLILISRTLSKYKIPCIALKGAYLAFHAYPDPALRPLRDLDILVPKQSTIFAYECLLSAGFTRNQKYPGSLEGALLTSHHLPPLLDPSRTLSIEIHSAISHSNEAFEFEADDFFWRNSILKEFSGELIRFPSPIDQLQHLIHHAAIHHTFDNGPLLISDIAYLISTHDIDWTLFWSQADKRGIVPICTLVLCMVKNQWPNAEIEMLSQNLSQISPGLIEDGLVLMLRDFDARSTISLKLSLAESSSRERITSVIKKFFPAKVYIASMYPVSSSSPQIYFYYVLNMLRLLGSRLPKILVQSKANHSDEMSRLSGIQQWLKNNARRP
jgi:hypothetical protein